MLVPTYKIHHFKALISSLTLQLIAQAFLSLSHSPLKRDFLMSRAHYTSMIPTHTCIHNNVILSHKQETALIEQLQALFYHLKFLIPK